MNKFQFFNLLFESSAIIYIDTDEETNHTYPTWRTGTFVCIKYN